MVVVGWEERGAGREAEGRRRRRRGRESGASEDSEPTTPTQPPSAHRRPSLALIAWLQEG
jgi:hypothetical protein